MLAILKKRLISRCYCRITYYNLWFLKVMNWCRKLPEYHIVYSQELSADFSGQFSLEDQLHLDNMNRLWDRFQLAQQEKDMALQAEISR